MKYKLDAEAIRKRVEDLGQTLLGTSRYVTTILGRLPDENWLNNRINPRRNTLATEEEVLALARYLQMDVDDITIKQTPTIENDNDMTLHVTVSRGMFEALFREISNIEESVSEIARALR